MKQVARIWAVAIAVGGGVPALADDPPPFPDFTFRMEKPPDAGTGKRITVQIDPDEGEPERAAATPEAEADGAARPDARIQQPRYGWFWANVPSDLSPDATERLRKAHDSLKTGNVPAPRLQALQAIAAEQGRHILRETIGTRVSPALVLAVIAVESDGRSGATSHKGAQGLMQLMPDTAQRFDVGDSLSPAENIGGGVAYLDWLLREFEGDAILALAGYNAGENAVRKHGGVPPFAETRDYIPKVLAAYEVASGLCQTQPDLITDACALTLAAN